MRSLWVLWETQETVKTIQAVALGCLSEVEGKSPLLKMPCPLDAGLEGTVLDLTQEPPPSGLDLKALERLCACCKQMLCQSTYRTWASFELEDRAYSLRYWEITELVAYSFKQKASECTGPHCPIHTHFSTYSSWVCTLIAPSPALGWHWINGCMISVSLSLYNSRQTKGNKSEGGCL